VARAIVYSFDVLVIATLLGRHSVGLYTAAYKPVLFAITALAIFYVSFLASYSAAEGQSAAQLFRRTVAIALGCTVPVALLIAIGSSAFCRLAYGSAYAGAALPLAILIWCVPVVAINGAYANALIAGHRERSLMFINVTGAGFNLLCTVVAVPLAGLAGAAAVTLASELLIMALLARSVVTRGLERSPVSIIVDFFRWHAPTKPPRAEG
jgi:O-antigen/teichoic acid export membrane protein